MSEQLSRRPPFEKGMRQIVFVTPELQLLHAGFRAERSFPARAGDLHAEPRPGADESLLRRRFPGARLAHEARYGQVWRLDWARRARNAHRPPTKLNAASITVTAGAAIGTPSPARSTNTNMPASDSGRFERHGERISRERHAATLRTGKGPGAVQQVADRHHHRERDERGGDIVQAERVTTDHDGVMQQRAQQADGKEAAGHHR